jgi:hypothetical protein
MQSKLSTPLVLLILMSLILSVMLVSVCAAAARPIGPQGPVGPQGAVGPNGNVGPQASVGPQAPTGPQEMVKSRGPVSLEEPGGQRGRFGPADPVVFVARVLKTVGLATEGG